jgi:uncharacterized glyoxalase superfamily protein PhnB
VQIDVNRAAPNATVVPILVYEDVEAALDFLVRAFRFAERLRAHGPGAIEAAGATRAGG